MNKIIEGTKEALAVVKGEKPAHTYSTEGPCCPYCLRQFTADDPGYYDEMNYTQDECDECGKTFSVSVHVSIAWSCDPID